MHFVILVVVLNGNNRCSAELKPDLDASNGKPNKALASIMRKNDAPMEPAHVPGMPVQEFADKIRQYASSDITVSEANALACELHRHVRQDEDFVNRSKPSQENKWDASGVGHKPSAHTRNGVDADAHVSAADMEYFVAQRKLQVLGELKRAQRPPVPIAAPSVEVVGSAGGSALGGTVNCGPGGNARSSCVGDFAPLFPALAYRARRFYEVLRRVEGHKRHASRLCYCCSTENRTNRPPGKRPGHRQQVDQAAQDSPPCAHGPVVGGLSQDEAAGGHCGL